MKEYLYFCMDDDGHVSIYVLLNDFLDFLKKERICAFSIFEKNNNVFKKNARYEIDFSTNLNYIDNIEELKVNLNEYYSKYECLSNIINFLNNEIEELKIEDEKNKKIEREEAYMQYLELKEKYNFN